jgi:hypothetical protein
LTFKNPATTTAQLLPLSEAIEDGSRNGPGRHGPFQDILPEKSTNDGYLERSAGW